jgi:N-acetylmuramate 1-kinase
MTVLPDSLLYSATTSLVKLFGPETAVSALEKIPGQASNRRYFRLYLDKSDTLSSVILVKLPDDPFASEEALGDDTEQILPFCAMQQFLKSRGLPVPEIYLDATRDGYLLQEDLGTKTLFRALRTADCATTLSLYKKAIDLLIAWQQATPAHAPQQPPPCIGYTRRFTSSLLRWELDHFREWLLEAYARVTLTDQQRRWLDNAFDKLVDELEQIPFRLAHRDFQSTNLMVRDNSLVLIDFQDALMAPPLYDLVSLCRDSYVALSPSQLDHLMQYYYARTAEELPFKNYTEFTNHFHVQTIQRKLKDAGRFVFIEQVKGNPDFLKWVQPTLGYVALSLSRLPHWAELKDFLTCCLPEPVEL